MMRSLFSAISGLRAHQTFMDVVGNNIANVNTTGFKASRLSFQDMISQTLQGGSPPQDDRGGTNPVQIGLGTQVGAISTTLTQGNLEATNRATDLAIQGNGYFVLGDNQGGRVFTRDGTFDLAVNGAMVNSSGLQLLGWVADVNGQIDTAQPLQPITIPTTDQMIGSPSTRIAFGGNLDQRLDATNPTAANKQVQVAVNVYDSLGVAHELTITFEKTDNATNEWSWTVTTSETGVTLGGTSSGTVDFLESGYYDDPDPTAADATLTLALTNGAGNLSLDLDFADLTQLASTSTASGTPDGQAPGALMSFSIGQGGEVTGIYSNGARRLLGQVAMASFPNPGGLLRQGGNLYTTSPNSGDAIIGTPGAGGRGALSAGFREMSNVDLAQEFTNMILAERGFQASSRVINASDSILQELVNLRR